MLSDPKFKSSKFDPINKALNDLDRKYMDDPECSGKMLLKLKYEYANSLIGDEQEYAISWIREQ